MPAAKRHKKLVAERRLGLYECKPEFQPTTIFLRLKAGQAS